MVRQIFRLKKADIDPSDYGNQQVYECTAVLGFVPITYYYTDDEVIRYKTVESNDRLIHVVSRGIYLIIVLTVVVDNHTYVFFSLIVCDELMAVSKLYYRHFGKVDIVGGSVEYRRHIMLALNVCGFYRKASDLP